MSRYIVVDIGAESGRLIVGNLSEGKLTLEEAHRFPNGAVEVNGHSFCWRMSYSNLLLGKTSAPCGPQISKLCNLRSL